MNGKELLDDLELSDKTASWSEPEKFLAQQVMKVRRDLNLLPCKDGECNSHRRQKISNSMFGAIAGAVAAGIVAGVNYLRGG